MRKAIAFWSGIARALVFSSSKLFGPFCVAVRQRWAAIAMPAYAVAIRPSPTTRVEIGTAPSVKRRPASAGWRHANANSSTLAISMSCSPCLTNSMCWPWKTRVCFTICCSLPAHKPCWKSHPIPNTSEPRSVSIAILHTWGQNLLLHPHIHCVIPAGGLSLDHRRWVRPRYAFFLPVKVLSRVFRGKFLAGLKRLHRNRLCCVGPAAALADPQQFSKLLRRLHRHDWVVYAKPAFGGPVQVLRYLGRYTHRVAISNHRLSAFDQERVTFRWKDYAHGGKHGKMTLGATEFLRRFFLHVLPKGFVRIRHFGFLANRFRASHLALGRQLLASGGSTEPEVKTNDAPSETSSRWHCPRCGASMIVIQRFTAAELSACMYFDSS